MQRIDVSHTVAGETTLAAWLGKAASLDTIAQRQSAVVELAADLDFRESLEASATRVQGNERIDPTPFLKFVERAPLVSTPLLMAIYIVPAATAAIGLAVYLGLMPRLVLIAAASVQVLLALAYARRAIDAFQLVAARRGYVEALRAMFVVVEEHEFESELLRSLQKRLELGGRPPSAYMARLDRWAGLAEFHTQFPIHFFVNLATFWDLHVLWRLERWVSDVGRGLDDAFAALAELEALCGLATLAATDPNTCVPELKAEPTPLRAEQLAHPLLNPEQRVANDLDMKSQVSALIITGSNMAGKSTLLRAVGLNMALALAGGPVVARTMRFSPVRLRASMRIDDSLQKGASYFHAELTKLRAVVGDASASPPVFFLLDELLRGTNARARHIGARAVLAHLLDRGASGLAATHDIALAKLESEQPERVRNVHFTDVMQGDEMTFDYKLRPGVVKTSNALRLLSLAGVEVPPDTLLPDMVVA